MQEFAMPELIATSVNTVMRGVRTLLKTERNRDGDYRFASIDGFLEALNPLCAKAGLIIIQNELDARLVHNGVDNQDRSWLWATFEFYLVHTSGAMWGPVNRSVMVDADGAQAFGAAQSYALKQFMRSLFQVPTGEKDDADHRPQVHPQVRPQFRPTRFVQRRPDLSDDVGEKEPARVRQASVDAGDPAGVLLSAATSAPTQASTV